MALRYLLLALCAAGAVGLPLVGALAHSKKETTTPADGAVLEAAPEVISMTFDSPMRVTMIRVTDANGSEIDLTRSDDMAPVTEFKALPAALKPGTYTVEWRGLSGDGHPMEGSFSFRIED
jgi:methionine-rich copper-binding protein CopC